MIVIVFTGQGAAKADDTIHFGQRLGQLVAVTLSHAARDHHAGASLATVDEGQGHINGFLPRRLDECARIHENQIGVGRRCGWPHPVGQQFAREFVGINLILRTPERLDPEAFRHGGPRYPPPPRDRPAKPWVAYFLATNHCDWTLQ